MEELFDLPYPHECALSRDRSPLFFSRRRSFTYASYGQRRHRRRHRRCVYERQCERQRRYVCIYTINAPCLLLIHVPIVRLSLSLSLSLSVNFFLFFLLVVTRARLFARARFTTRRKGYWPIASLFRPTPHCRRHRHRTSLLSAFLERSGNEFIQDESRQPRGSFASVLHADQSDVFFSVNHA